MYRRTRKYQARHAQPRPDVAPADQRPATWQPPPLRRRITIEDFDGEAPRTHTIELFRTRRIDSYRAVVDGAEWKSSVGWSRVLDGMRRALPRLLSPRHEDAARHGGITFSKRQSLVIRLTDQPLDSLMPRVQISSASCTTGA